MGKRNRSSQLTKLPLDPITLNDTMSAHVVVQDDAVMIDVCASSRSDVGAHKDEDALQDLLDMMDYDGKDDAPTAAVISGENLSGMHSRDSASPAVILVLLYTAP